MNVINAANGETVFEFQSFEDFDRWYDQHSEYRFPRDDSEVHPDLRELARQKLAASVVLVRDES